MTPVTPGMPFISCRILQHRHTLSPLVLPGQMLLERELARPARMDLRIDGEGAEKGGRVRGGKVALDEQDNGQVTGPRRSGLEPEFLHERLVGSWVKRLHARLAVDTQQSKRPGTFRDERIPPGRTAEVHTSAFAVPAHDQR